MTANLLCMSLSGALMAAAILVVRALALHRLPKQVFVVLWALVALRLLVPVWIPAPFSAFGLVQQQMPALGETLGVPAESAAGTDGEHPDGTARTSETSTGPSTSTLATASSSIERASGTVTPAGGASGGAAAIAQNPSPTGTLGNRPDGPNPLSIAIPCVGALGSAGFGLFFGIAYLRARQDFRTSLPVRDPRARTLLERRPLPNARIQLRTSDRVGTPLTYGIARPVILMPASTDWGDVERLSFVLDHELAHIRRRDAWLKLLLVVATCLHWWNPLAWVMFALANRDIELACDETVLRGYGPRRRAGYARALLAMEARRSGLPSIVCTAFGKTAIEERIGAIMSAKRFSTGALVASTLLIVGIPAALATSADVPDATGGAPDQPAAAQAPAADTSVTDPALAELIAQYTDDEWQQLRDFLGAQFALEYDTINQTTVAQFRDAALETFGTPEGRDLLDRLSADDALRAWATSYTWGSDTTSDVATVAFIYYGLLPLTSDDWESATFSGSVEIPVDQTAGDGAVLNYRIEGSVVDDPERVMLWTYLAATLQPMQWIPELIAAVPSDLLGDPNGIMDELGSLTEEKLAPVMDSLAGVIPIPTYSYRSNGSGNPTVVSTFTVLFAADQAEANQQDAAQDIALTLLASYQDAGLAHEVSVDDSGQRCYALTYEGQPVGRVFDALYGMTVTDFFLSDADEGAIDLIARYENDELAGLFAVDADEFADAQAQWPQVEGGPSVAQ